VEKKKLIELVKKLREETGAGVMLCKKALEEAKGDYQKAKKAVAKKTKKQALAKQDRVTKQGFVASYTHATGKVGVLVELLCETDFVARNEEFRRLAHELCLQIAAMAPQDVEELLAQEYIREPEKTIGDLLKEAIAKFGENIKIGSFARKAVG